MPSKYAAALFKDTTIFDCFFFFFFNKIYRLFSTVAVVYKRKRIYFLCSVGIITVNEFMYGFNLKAKIQQRNIFYLCGRFRTQHNHRLHKGHRTHLPYVFFCKTIYKIQNVPMSLVPGSYVLRF